MNFKFKVFLLSLSLGRVVIGSAPSNITQAPSVLVVAATVGAVLVVHHVMSVPRYETKRTCASSGFGRSFIMGSEAYTVRNKGSFYQQIAENCTVS